MPRVLADEDVVSFGSPYVNVGSIKKPNPCQFRLLPSGAPTPDAVPATQAAQPMPVAGRGVVDLTEVPLLTPHYRFTQFALLHLVLTTR